MCTCVKSPTYVGAGVSKTLFSVKLSANKMSVWSPSERFVLILFRLQLVLLLVIFVFFFHDNDNKI